MSEVTNIPILRFPEFEDHYSKYRLDQLLDLLTDFEANGSFASVKENVTVYDDHNFAWYVRATDLENNSDPEGVKYVDEHSYNFLKKTKLFGDELLITKRGEIGKVYYFQGQVKSTLAPNLYLLKLNSDVVSKYLFYFFKGLKGNKKLRRINASTTIGALYKDDVKSIKVDTPSLPEQQKIADFLTTVDKRIELLEKKKTLLETYKKGVMKKIFDQEIRFKDDKGNDFPDWEEKKVKDVFRVTRGNVLSVNQMTESENLDYRYPVYSSQTKNKGVVGYYNEFLFQDSLTWTTDGANAGEVNFRKEKFYCTNVCGVLISENGFANECISNLINSVSKRYVSYVGNPKLMNGVMAEIKLAFPSIKEQEKISEFLSSIDIQIELLETQIEKSKTWKKGLLQKMFV